MEWHWILLIVYAIWITLAGVLESLTNTKLRRRMANLYERDNHGTFRKVSF